MTNAKAHLPSTGLSAIGQRARLRLIDTVDTPVREVFADSQSSGQVWARRYRSKLRISDVSIIVVAVGVAFVARFGTDAAAVAAGPFRVDYWVVALMVVSIWIITLGAFHTRDSRVIGVGANEYRQVVNASALAFGLLAIAFLVFQIDIARSFFIFALPLGMIGLTLERWLWRKWLLHQRHFGHYLSRVIVVGIREDVEYVVRQIAEKSGAAYHVVGVALEDGDTTGVLSRGKRIPVVADSAHVAGAVTSMGVDAVVVAGQPRGGSTFIRNLGWDLEGTSAELVLSSRLTDVAGPRIHFRPVEGLPLIHVEIPHFEGTRHVLKRTLDVVAAGCGLLLIAPLLAVIAIVVKADTPGPALFRQERCGRNEQTFQMLKFRSMVQTAEKDLAGLLDKNEGSGVLFKIRNDPRVTRVGRILRKYSLDELPQLWNVLVGEMSLVGPRPPLPTEVDGYEEHVHRRLYIKPGLTGMWQVNGRSDLDWDESVRLDLYYVENWSLAGDLMILWRTLRVLTHPSGAY
ncbi:sugar transferase [Cryobacterium sp. HLT2-28]|uniref:sugar transferase n=1 Tax=Cryobacterium sp. HLT2-28 TaxID=1259146 RepID=UPI00106B2622|nr:sugar transferase [Cryobacterium sp. HLT2-28]TFB91736.1 sugar transferase [Cryobacterium sp. HLT2-28]